MVDRKKGNISLNTSLHTWSVQRGNYRRTQLKLSSLLWERERTGALTVYVLALLESHSTQRPRFNPHTLFVWHKVSLCCSGLFWNTICVDYASFELTCLCLPSPGVKGVYHHCPPSTSYFYSIFQNYDVEKINIFKWSKSRLESNVQARGCGTHL